MFDVDSTPSFMSAVVYMSFTKCVRTSVSMSSKVSSSKLVSPFFFR